VIVVVVYHSLSLLFLEPHFINSFKKENTFCSKRSFEQVTIFREMEPQFFDASLIMSVTFPDNTGEVSKQIISFKIWPQIGH
jgi:hypothetical protein